MIIFLINSFVCKTNYCSANNNLKFPVLITSDKENQQILTLKKL